MNAHVNFVTNRCYTADLSNEILCHRIDAFVRQQDGSTPFHLTAWSRAVEKGAGSKARYLYSEGANGILGVLPCHIIRSPFFGDAIVSTAFGVSGGVLGKGAGLLEQMFTAGVIERCPVLEVRGGALPERNWEIEESRHIAFSRPLPAEAADLLDLIPRKRRASIRKALEAGFSVSTGRSAEYLDAHYKIYAEAMRNLGTPVFPKSLFGEVLAELGDEADIIIVRRGRELLSSVLVLYHKGAAMPYWGGGTAMARSLGANDLLYFEAMRHAIVHRGCKIFDFGRSKTGSAHAAYKHSFGCEGVPLRYASRVIRSGYDRDTNPNSPRYRVASRLWRKLPLPIATLIGPSISVGLG